jgi:archaellin
MKKKKREEKMGVGAVEVIILIIFCLVMAVAAVVLALKGAYKVGRPIAKGTAKILRRAARSSRVAAS